MSFPYLIISILKAFLRLQFFTSYNCLFTVFRKCCSHRYLMRGPNWKTTKWSKLIRFFRDLWWRHLLLSLFERDKPYFLARKTFPKAPLLIGLMMSKSLIVGAQWDNGTAGFLMSESRSMSSSGDELRLESASGEDPEGTRWSEDDRGPGETNSVVIIAVKIQHLLFSNISLS